LPGACASLVAHVNITSRSSLEHAACSRMPAACELGTDVGRRKPRTAPATRTKMRDSRLQEHRRDSRPQEQGAFAIVDFDKMQDKHRLLHERERDLVGGYTENTWRSRSRRFSCQSNFQRNLSAINNA
jgi:hypothetical protein